MKRLTSCAALALLCSTLSATIVTAQSTAAKTAADSKSKSVDLCIAPAGGPIATGQTETTTTARTAARTATALQHALRPLPRRVLANQHPTSKPTPSLTEDSGQSNCRTTRASGSRCVFTQTTSRSFARPNWRPCLLATKRSNNWVFGSSRSVRTVASATRFGTRLNCPR